MKKISVFCGLMLFATFLIKGNNVVLAQNSEIVSNATSSISITTPKANSNLKVGDIVPVSWSNQNINADYFYILLENTALKDVGFIVKDNLFGVSSTSFTLSSVLSKVISLNTTNLTESQINGRYFVRVVAMKKATPYDKVVSSGTSDLFSINSGSSTPATIYVTAPSGGQINKNSGSTVIIGWKHTADINHEFGINLLKLNGDLAANIKTCSTPSSKTQDSGSLSYSWKNGYDAYGKEIPNGRYNILVYDCAGITVSGRSNDSFELISGNNTGTTTNPYLEIVSPVANRTYLFGSRLYVAWNARNTDVDFYYALLENTAIKDFGFVVADNISPSTTTTSFLFNKKALDIMLSSRVGLTEAQLQNGYYVRIIGVKKGSPYSNAVINATSGIFSISNSSNINILVSTTSAKLGSPVMVNNVIVSQPYEMSLTIKNDGQSNIYIRNKGDGRDVVFNTSPYTATSTPPFINASPATIAGDGVNYFVIPIGASRVFSYYGSLKNTGQLGTVSHEMVGIVYGESNAWPEGYVIPLPQGSLRLSTVFGTGTDNTPVISSINPSSGPVGTVITLKGKNLAGFEGDLDAWIKNSNGQVAYLAPYGKSVYPKTDQITVLISDKVCKTNNSYTGMPCKEYLPIVPGNYKIFTSPWGKNSNEVYFAVSNEPTPSPTPTNTSVIPLSNNSMRVISPNGGEVLKKGSTINIYYNKKPNDGSYRTDMYLIANDSQSVYTIQGKAGGTGIIDSSLGDSVVMYGWTVGGGSIINGVATSDIPAGYYKLKVCLTGTNVCDLSDRAFAISETPVTPVYSPTPTPSATVYYNYTPTPTPIYSSTPTPTATPVYSSTPSPTPTPVYSSTPTATPTPVYSSTPTPTSTPSPTSSSSPRPSSSPTAFMIDQNSLNASIWSIVKNLFSIQ